MKQRKILVASAVAVLLIGVLLLAWYQFDKKREVPVSNDISFSEVDFTAAVKVQIRDLHTGVDYFAEAESDVSEITAFLSSIEGTDRMSSKGYYGGTVEVELFDREGNSLFCIGFGDDDTFNFGDTGKADEVTGVVYPNRYTLSGLVVTRSQVESFFEEILGETFASLRKG